MKKKTAKEIKSLLATAWEAGCSSVKIEGIEYQRPKETAPEGDPSPFPIPEGMTEEEILFYATPYYDELQEKKKKREEALRLERNLRNG